MQDWDRVATLALGAGVAGWTARQAWLLLRRGRRLPALGLGILALAALAVPAALALLAT